MIRALCPTCPTGQARDKPRHAASHMAPLYHIRVDTSLFAQRLNEKTRSRMHGEPIATDLAPSPGIALAGADLAVACS